MSDVLIVGILSTIAVIISPIITLFIKNWIDHRSLLNITKSRRIAIKGLWGGSIKYDRSEAFPQEEIQVEADINPGKKVITGEIRYTDPKSEKKVILILRGGFLNDSFLQMEYKNRDESMLQFGGNVMELSPDATRLTGLFHGFGRHSNQLVSGKIELARSE